MSEIVDEQYHHFPNTTVVVCVVTNEDGAHGIGYAASHNPRKFNQPLGRAMAHERAVHQLAKIEALRESWG